MSAIGAKHVFIATDSERALADAAALYPELTFMSIPNVSRSGLRTPPPQGILDVTIKRRAASGRGVAATEHDALQGAVDALLLARCDVLVGKFSSGLFRAAYALAAARRGGGLLPFISLDAPWCSDYGVPTGHNDDFPDRLEGGPQQFEQIVPDDSGRGRRSRGVELRRTRRNVFLC